MTKQAHSFEEIYEQNQRRIHYHIHKLNIHDQHNDFYQEGLFALWKAYERYDPDMGPMATYFNYMIRNRLIDQIRKDVREREKQESYLEEQKALYSQDVTSTKDNTPENTFTSQDNLLENPDLWNQIKARLSGNQWKWVYYYVIGNMPLKEIAIREDTTVEAVKSWAKEARKKLRKEEFRALLEKEMTN